MPTRRAVRALVEPGPAAPRPQHGEMRYGIVAIELPRRGAAKRHCLQSLALRCNFRKPDESYQPEGLRYPEGKSRSASRWGASGFLRTPHLNLGNADPTRCAGGQVSIQKQRLFRIRQCPVPAAVRRDLDKANACGFVHDPAITDTLDQVPLSASLKAPTAVVPVTTEPATYCNPTICHVQQSPGTKVDRHGDREVK